MSEVLRPMDQGHDMLTYGTNAVLGAITRCKCVGLEEGFFMKKFIGKV